MPSKGSRRSLRVSVPRLPTARPAASPESMNAPVAHNPSVICSSDQSLQFLGLLLVPPEVQSPTFSKQLKPLPHSESGCYVDSYRELELAHTFVRMTAGQDSKQPISNDEVQFLGRGDDTTYLREDFLPLVWLRGHFLGLRRLFIHEPLPSAVAFSPKGRPEIF